MKENYPCMDYHYAMTAEQHALLHISEELVRLKIRMEALESVVKDMDKHKSPVMPGNPR